MAKKKNRKKPQEQLPLIKGESSKEKSGGDPSCKDSSGLNSEDVSLDLWGELYELAAQVKEDAPWEMMSESEMFAVVHPDSGETGYCSVMGGGGEYFAVAVYLGDEGMRSLIDLVEGLFDQFDLVISQKCLMLSWEDRADAHKCDLAQYKALGLKFRGRGQYPLFRFHEPGFEPWFIDRGQAEFMKVVLQRVLEVSEGAAQDPDYFANTDAKIPCFTMSGDAWRKSWMKVDPPDERIEVPPLNELEVQRFINAMGRCEAVLELDYFYIPGKIKGDPKPCYPRMVMVTDEAGPVVAFDMVTTEDLYKAVQQQLCLAIERVGATPKEILVLRMDLYEMLHQYAQLFGFEVLLVDRLAGQEEAKKALGAMLHG